jgi:DNA-binding NtrC family response regulator
LVVDDTDGVRSIAVRALEDAGFRAVAAVDGLVALNLVCSLPQGWFDLIITNSLMPGMRGEELVELLLKRDPAQRVLHITGHPDVTFAADAGVAGAIPALRKPFTPDQLLRIVRELTAAP